MLPSGSIIFNIQHFPFDANGTRMGHEWDVRRERYAKPYTHHHQLINQNLITEKPHYLFTTQPKTQTKKKMKKNKINERAVKEHIIESITSVLGS